MAWDAGQTLGEWPLDAVGSRRLALAKRTYKGTDFYELRREKRDLYNEGSWRLEDRTSIRLDQAKDVGEALIKVAEANK